MAEKSAKNRKRGIPFTADHQPDPSLIRKKKNKTILKEAIGLDSWDSIQAYLVGEGAAKFIEEIKKMDGKDYANNYLAAMEYFKPKLARTEMDVKSGGKTIKHNVIRLTDGTEIII